MPAQRLQLWMRLRLPHGLPEPDLPPGYQLRTFQTGDEAPWIELLNTGFDPWDSARLQRMLARKQPRLPLDGIFFITHDERIAASACLFLHTTGEETSGELGWVVVDPAHQGQDLGRRTCLAALRYAQQHSLPSVYLRTEEPRIAAIRIYRKLGFEPEMRDDTHPGRWAVLLPRLNL